VNFQKWQALGNDYVIIEAGDLPFELTPARVQRLCASHTGIGSDGIVLLARSERDDLVAELRIFNPDGSEAGVSGNGAREAILYLRRQGWTEQSSFAIGTQAGVLHAQVTSPTSASVDMGQARLASVDYPGGSADGRGELTAGGRRWPFQHVQVGNPQCSIAMTDQAELDSLDLPAIGPEIERHALFPNRTNVSWFTVVQPGLIRARIFERGVGETTASGTGAIGAAVSHVLQGGASPVTVLLEGGELEVTVSEDLHLRLTGWALPVMRGTVSEELVEELQDLEVSVAAQ
jgi:diaminopimelate epimerase